MMKVQPSFLNSKEELRRKGSIQGVEDQILSRIIVDGDLRAREFDEVLKHESRHYL